MTNNSRILIVDNHKIFLEGLFQSLSNLGYTSISSATSCYEALHKIKTARTNDPFELLLTDLSFECSDANQDLDSGESLIKRLKKENIKIKIKIKIKNRNNKSNKNISDFIRFY